MINKLYILYIHCLLWDYNRQIIITPPPTLRHHIVASRRRYVRTTGQIPAGAPAGQCRRQWLNIKTALV